MFFISSSHLSETGMDYLPWLLLICLIHICVYLVVLYVTALKWYSILSVLWQELLFGVKHHCIGLTPYLHEMSRICCSLSFFLFSGAVHYMLCAVSRLYNFTCASCKTLTLVFVRGIIRSSPFASVIIRIQLEEYRQNMNKQILLSTRKITAKVNRYRSL